MRLLLSVQSRSHTTMTSFFSVNFRGISHDILRFIFILLSNFLLFFLFFIVVVVLFFMCLMLMKNDSQKKTECVTHNSPNLHLKTIYPERICGVFGVAHGESPDQLLPMLSSTNFVHKSYRITNSIKGHQSICTANETKEEELIQKEKEEEATADGVRDHRMGSNTGRQLNNNGKK